MSRIYEDKTVMHLALFDAWTGYAVTTVYAEVKWARQRETMFKTFYGKDLSRVVAGMLRVEWEEMKHLHAVEFHIVGMGNKEGRGGKELRENSEFGAVRTVCRKRLSSAKGVVSGEYDKAALSRSELLCNISQSG